MNKRPANDFAKLGFARRCNRIICKNDNSSFRLYRDSLVCQHRSRIFLLWNGKNGQQFVVPQILVKFYTPKDLENMNPIVVFFAAIKKICFRGDLNRSPKI